MNARIPEPFDPDWLLADFDAPLERFHFARVGIGTYRQSSFLDHRIQPMPAEVISLPGTQVDAALSQRRDSPARYVLHTGFCASTLMAFCLDHPDRTLVLREPLVLSRLAAVVRDPGLLDRASIDRLASRVLRLLDRSYAGEAVIVKPSNFANAIAPWLVGRSRPGEPDNRRLVLMSCSLDSLLVSLLKKREEAERSLPGFVQSLLRDSDYAERVGGLPPLDTLHWLQLGVLFWHAQRHGFDRLVAKSASANLPVTLERFLAQPEAVLAEVDGFLHLGLGPEVIHGTVSAGAFRRHSKDGAIAYDPASQRREYLQVRSLYRAELDSVRRWAKPLLDRLPPGPWGADDRPLG